MPGSNLTPVYGWRYANENFDQLTYEIVSGEDYLLDIESTVSGIDSRTTAAEADIDELQARRLFAANTGPQTLTPSSTALQNVTDLVVAVPGGATAVWRIDCLVLFESNQSADLKLAFTRPSGSTLSWALSGLLSTGTNFEATAGTVHRQVDDTAAAVAGLGAGVATSAQMMGLLRMGASAGNLQLRAAQNATHASDTKILADTYLSLTRVA